jgi:hypothetical protein
VARNDLQLQSLRFPANVFVEPRGYSGGRAGPAGTRKFLRPSLQGRALAGPAGTRKFLKHGEGARRSC